MMNLGGRPTFGEERRTLEVHMFDVDGDFYGDRVDIAFVARLRDTVRFPNPEALVTQLHRDADAARRALTALASRVTLMVPRTFLPPLRSRMSNLKWRFALIGALVLVSAWALFPRNVKVRQRRADGTFFDTTTYRVPLRKGLDLSGGMHLALEVDDTKGVVADKSQAIDRALKVVRTRIEGLGVSETVIQKAGSDRIIVEIPASTTASARSRWSRTRRSSSSRSPTRPTGSRRRCRDWTPSRRRRDSVAPPSRRRRRDTERRNGARRTADHWRLGEVRRGCQGG
jgi:hypothetical protein